MGLFRFLQDLYWGPRRAWMLALVLIVYPCLIAWRSYHESATLNEYAHLAAGVSHLELQRFDLFRVNPPLIRTIAALPVVAAAPATANWIGYDLNPLNSSWDTVGANFANANGSRFETNLFLARLSCLSFALIGAFVCWRWSRRLYGVWAGRLSVVMWCSSPYILGHAALITPDAHAASIGLLAFYVFWRWLQKPEWLETTIAGLVLGLAELCKFTFLIFYPLLPLLWIVYQYPNRKAMNKYDWLHQGGMISTILLVSVCVINCGYLFEGSFKPLGDFHFQTILFTGHDSLNGIPPDGANRFANTWVAKIPVPLPANFLQGIDRQRFDFERGLSSYCRGQWSDHGWWYYYLYALAIKVPLGTWCLVALAIGAMTFGWNYSSSWRDEVFVLTPFVIILAFVSSQTGFSVHSRYVIPALPFLFVWTSKIARVFEMRPFNKRRLMLAVTVVVALVWTVGSSLSIYPHSLSYFNELAAVLPTPADASYPKPIEKDENHGIWAGINATIIAGPRNGPRHLLDSNIDWGQDLFNLKNWLGQHSEVKLNGLAYWGARPGRIVGISDAPWPPSCPLSKQHSVPEQQCGPKPGWYALSANCIYGRDRQYRYFLHLQPATMAGYSIYIYHITLDEANQVRKELGLPELKE